MEVSDFEEPYAARDRQRRGGRQNAAKRVGARQLVQRTAWLSHPLVYWSGTPPRGCYEPAVAYRPITQVIADRLASQPPGIYALQFDHLRPLRDSDARTEEATVSINPAIVTLIPITSQLVAETTQALVASKRYPKAFPKIVEDMATWGSRVEHHLQCVTAARQGLANRLTNDPHSLVLEETCLWIGPDELRPSHCLETAAIRSWLEKGPDASAPGKRLAAIVLGQRQKRYALPQELAEWMLCGSRLSWWPADVICRLSHHGRDSLRLAQAACACPGLKTQDTALAMLEYRFAAPDGDVGALLRVLPQLIDTLEAFITLEDDGLSIAPLSKEWGTTVIGLTGRLAAFGNPLEVVPYLTTWLDECRKACPPGDRAESAVTLAVAGLESGLALSGWLESNVRRWFEVLGTCGSDLLAWAIHQASWSALTYDSLLRWIGGDKKRGGGLPHSAVLGGLGVLRIDQCQLIIQHDLFDSIEHILAKNPAALVTFMNWVATCDERWFRLASYKKSTWAELFCLKNQKLALLLADCSTAMVSKDGFTWDHAKSFLDEILLFCGRRWRGRGRDDGPRQEFLARHLWICEKLLLAAQQYMEAFPEEGFKHGLDPEEALCRRVEVLEIAYQWSRQGWRHVEVVVDTLLQRCANQDRAAIAQGRTLPLDYFQGNEDDYSLAARIAAGQPARLLSLLASQAAEWHFPDDPLKGWLFLEHHRSIQEFLSRCADRRELVPRILKLLHRVALAARLPSRHWLGDEFARWESPPRITAPQLPESFPVRIIPELQRLLAYRSLAGKQIKLPKTIKRISDRPQTLREEHHALVQRARDGRLTQSAAARMEKLRLCLANPERLNSWVEQDLAAALVRQIPLAQLEALETIVQTAIRQHWQSILAEAPIDSDNADWDNALWLYSTTHGNQRLLKELLQHQARGDRHWIHQHPCNQAFIRKMRAIGIDMDAWMGSFEDQYVINGETWTVFAETDPLRVLQMGNLFSTCLSVGAANAFSTIANAVEVNKRVLYLRNGKGRVIGRKLIALQHDGTLLGFHSYGGATSYDGGEGTPWVKILFDWLCLSLARHTGACLADTEDAEGLALFAKWYDDGPEPFDWWITDHMANTDLFNSGDITPLTEAITRHLRERRAQEATLRALIWLGDDALPILQGPLTPYYLSPEQIGFIGRHSRSRAVSSAAKRWLDNVKGV